MADSKDLAWECDETGWSWKASRSDVACTSCEDDERTRSGRRRRIAEHPSLVAQIACADSAGGAAFLHVTALRRWVAAGNVGKEGILLLCRGGGGRGSLEDKSGHAVVCVSPRWAGCRGRDGAMDERSAGDGLCRLGTGSLWRGMMCSRSWCRVYSGDGGVQTLASEPGRVRRIEKMQTASQAHGWT